MKSTVTLFLFFLITFLVIGQSATDENKTKNNETLSPTQLLSNAIENKKCVGISAGYSVLNQKQWSGSDGYSNKEEKHPFSVTTLTRTASISKPVTAIAIMQLIEKGKLSLNQSLSDILPKELIKDKGHITVKQILEHSSGIGDYTSNKERENSKEYETLSEASSIFMDRKLNFKPGSDFSYSSYGYTILGIIIENISDMSFEDYLKTNIFDKAGMIHTRIEKFGASYSNKSNLFHRNSRGKIKEAKPTNLSDRIPAGGLLTTVEDMLKFGDAILNGTLIKAETLNLMAKDSGLKKEGSGYGLGWYLYGNNPDFGNVIGHTGGQIGCSGIFFLLPEAKTTTIVLSNTSGALQEVSNIGVQLFNIALNANKE
nr:serine hydrolase domain-containing protein [uncultured Psychroserpens sp.]